MVDVLLLGTCGNFDPDVLHHPQIAVEHDMAVEHGIADEALVARAHDDGDAGLKSDGVEPLSGKPRKIRVETGTGRVDHFFAFGIADRNDLERIDVDMKGVPPPLDRDADAPFLDTSQRKRVVDPIVIGLPPVGQELPFQFITDGPELDRPVSLQFRIRDGWMRDERSKTQSMFEIANNPAPYHGI